MNDRVTIAVGILRPMIMIGLVLSCISAPVFASDTLFVRASAPPGGDGRGWQNAFRTVHQAIAIAFDTDEIWVAAGTYLVGSEGLNIHRGVRLYGGFEGFEEQRERRNWLRHETVVQARPKTGSILTITGVDTTTLIDGFTFRDAISSAVVVFEGSPRIRNCFFVNNSGFSGGAIIADRSTGIRVQHCVFQSNRANRGGAIAIVGTSPNTAGAHHVIEQCAFDGNTADTSGGAVFLDLSGGVLEVLSSVFVENVAAQTAGAIHARRGAIDLVNGTCRRNRALGSLSRTLTLLCEDGGSVVNTIVWNDTTDLTPNIRVVNRPGSASTFRYAQNLIERDYYYGTIRGLPSFVDPDRPKGADGWWGTSDDGLSLKVESAGVNAGVNDETVWHTASDMVGNRRRIFGRLQVRHPDIGAYEMVSARSALDTLLDELRSGGLVLLFRHAQAKQVRTAEDVGCAEIPTLTIRGKENADEIGKMLALIGVQPGEVITGDACGMRQTAAYLSNTWRVDEHWMERSGLGGANLRIADLERIPIDGSRYIVTSEDVIAMMWPGDVGQVLESDALVIRPRGEGKGFDLVSHWTYDTFSRLYVLLPGE